MSEHQRYESFRSFFGSRIDPEKSEELKRAKPGIEGTAKKILRVPGDDYNVGKDRSVNWIEDFSKHDQSLYERYVHPTEELRKKADGKYGKDSWSSSDSDEKERLHGEYQTALSKTQVSPMILQLVEKESERLNQMELESEMQLEKEIETLKQEVANKISEMNRSKEEKNNLLKQFNSLERGLNSAHNQMLELYESVNRAETLREELEKRTVEHEEVSEEKKKLEGLFQEINTLWNKENEVEQELKKKTAERIKILEDNIKLDFQVERLYLEIQTLWNQKYEVEEKLRTKTAGHQNEDEQNHHLEMKQKYEVQLGKDEKLSVRVANANMEQFEDGSSQMQMEKSQLGSQEVVDGSLSGLMLACHEAQAQVTAEIDDIMTEFEAYSMELDKDFDGLKEILRCHGEGN